MRITQFPLLVPLILLSWCMSAQELLDDNELCHAEVIHREMLRINSEYFRKNQALERIISQKIREGSGTANQSGVTTYTIPLVVHVIHRKGTAVGVAENRSYADIAALVQGLNDDFSHASGIMYSNSNYGVQTNIEFCLAARDPNGDPTDGIDRHADDARTVYDRQTPANNPTPGLQEMYHWPTSDYYNIYLIHDIIGASGFAYFAPAHGAYYDGAVMEATVSAGVWSHEVGHAFYLYHTFQDSCINNNCWQNGDRICDTPPRGTSSYAGGNCSGPANSCDTDDDDLQPDNPYRPIANGGMGDQVDMFENYMDYTSACWSAFTIDQKDRMRWAIETYRSSYLISQACDPPLNNDAIVLDVQFRDTCGAALIGVNAVIGSLGSAQLNTVDINLYIDSVFYTTVPWAGNLSNNQTDTVEFDFTSTSVGNHFICILVSNPNGNADENSTNDEKCGEHFVDDTSCATCFDGIQNGDEIQIDCGGACLPCPCTENVILVEDELADGTVIQARQLVTANNVVASSGSIFFKAGNSIELNSGFSVPPEVTFAATIEDCDIIYTQFYEDFSGTTQGTQHGIVYEDDGCHTSARFFQTTESRIQYSLGNQIPYEGTIEFWVKIDSGYHYQNYALEFLNNQALLFTTDVWHGDVTWPGSTWLWVRNDGRIQLTMATTKYGSSPAETVLIDGSAFRFGQWHAIGISYGSEGQYIMLDGQLVASAPANTQIMGSGGNHSSPVDIPSIGESVPGFWNNNQYEGGFEGVVDKFRSSPVQRDWELSAGTVPTCN